MGKVKWHALWQGFLAFYLTIVAGTTLADFVGQKEAGMLALVGAGLQAGTSAAMGVQLARGTLALGSSAQTEKAG